MSKMNAHSARKEKMMKVFDPDSTIFTEEVIRESQGFVDGLKKITGPTDQFDNEIFANYEAVRFCEVVQATPIQFKEARAKLDEAYRKKRDLKIQAENQRKAIFHDLEEMSKPVISYLSECADEAISRVWRLRIFQHSGLESNVFTDKISTQVETNLPRVYEIRELLLNFKLKIHSMAHFPLKEIQILLEEVNEKVNFIDLRKVEVVSMSLYEAQGIEADLKENTSIPISAEVARLADRGWMEETYENVKAKVKRVTGSG